jgi:membrane fusion protein, copper/silver efflux system
MNSKPFSSPHAWVVAFVLLLLAGSILFAAEQQLYTCGMHPQIIKTEPGDCPICGMK